MKRPITPRGFRLLRDELQRLKAMRPELAHAIEVARAHGDISENSEYDAAKEKAGLVEAKIKDIEGKLAQADVIDPRSIKEPKRVMFGVTVKLLGIDSSEEKVVMIVGPDESDIDKGWLSCESPLGKALIGREVGDVVRINAPGGSREYEVVDLFVEYED